jgi:hypothetical protein
MEQVPLTLLNPQAQAHFIPHRAVPPPWVAPLPLRIWHLTSLDAPTVAVVWTLSFAWSANLRLPWRALVLLALAAWVVYVGDRLLDARTALRTGQNHRLRQRHLFHWRHRRILFPLAILAACAAVSIFLILVPSPVRQQDSALAIAALAYFTGVHAGRRRQPFEPQLSAQAMPQRPAFPSKEMLVGLLFTAACALPTLARLPNTAALVPLLAPILFFALLAWLNCHAIEQWESTTANPSARLLPRSTPTFFLATLLALTGLVLASVEFPFHPRPAAMLAAGAMSSLLLALLDRRRRSLSPLALRVAADLVLLAPALLPPLALLFR